VVGYNDATVPWYGGKRVVVVLISPGHASVSQRANVALPCHNVTRPILFAMLQSIDHVNLVVDDLERMIAFYRDVLGLEVTKHVTISGKWIEAVVGLVDVQAEVVYLSFPTGPNLELIKYHAPAAADSSATGSLAADGTSQANTPGLRHVAFRTDDIDALHARLTAADVTFFSPVQQVPGAQVTYSGGVSKRLVYFRDPEGNLLELCEYKSR